MYSAPEEYKPMPSQPSISSWMTMDNPQGGEDDCFDAIGTYAEVEERNENRSLERGNDGVSGDDSVLDPLMGMASCLPSTTNFPLSSQADNREPNPMDADENDVGPRVEHKSGPAVSRQERRRISRSKM